MTEKNIISSSKIEKKRRKGINQDALVFVFFLFLSFIFWYLNALGKVVQTEIKYPVEFLNLPEDGAVFEDQPAKLTLSLKGTGYSLIKLKLLSNRAPVIIDFSKVNYKRVPGSNSLNYFIIDPGITKNIITKLKSEFETVTVKPDTIFFRLNMTVSESR